MLFYYFEIYIALVSIFPAGLGKSTCCIDKHLYIMKNQPSPILSRHL